MEGAEKTEIEAACSPARRPSRSSCLVKRYGRTPAVKGVDLRVERPSGPFGLLGPNGSSKTTTLSCALGLLHPTSGSCTVLEGAGEALHRTRGRVGCVFDVPARCAGTRSPRTSPTSAPSRTPGRPPDGRCTGARRPRGLRAPPRRRPLSTTLRSASRSPGRSWSGFSNWSSSTNPSPGSTPWASAGCKLLEELAQDGQTLIVSGAIGSTRWSPCSPTRP